MLRSNQSRMWDEARDLAVCEILAKYRKELDRAHRKHFKSLMERETLCKHLVGEWINVSTFSCSVCGEIIFKHS